ncbi:hypothetical protein PYS58_01080 [Chryseobacterium indologenes]|uniref:hypothetical protein n=1 Tax=Chryseobacterium indologenes TaxID=253 RepID=UPI0023E84B62|nr:hypothetical protein [Chryseobacterium indologenes]WET49729.1 hypothetical protein PYS58_01080 [Chryseobacterium indologenes]
MKHKLYLILLFLTCQLLAQNNYYWVGGAGSWSDLNHWRIGSASGQPATIIPSRYDNVYITSGSGFPASGGMLTIPSSATCKDFIIDDSFTTKLNFPSGSVFNIYGNLKWKSNATALYSLTMNLFSESSNPIPNLIDVPDNMIDPSYISGSYPSNFNLNGNGTFKLVKNFASNGFFFFNVNDNAFLDTDNKDINTMVFSHSSSAASNFRSSVVTTTSTMTLNSAANFTQATLTFPVLTIQTTQNIKKINLTASGYSQITGGNLLTVDEVTGVGTAGGSFTGTQFNFNKVNLYACSINASLCKANDIILGDGSAEMQGTRFEIKNLTLGKGNNIFRATQFDINNLTLNGGQYNFRQTVANSYFQVNQTLIANIPCNGIMPKFAALEPLLPLNLIIPGSINGNGTAIFNGYTLSSVKLTGGASITADIDGGNNTGTIIYPGIAAKTYYWIGGGGNWNDPAHWSFTSGGPSANCIPIMYDDVIFNENSGFTLGNNTINSGGTTALIRNMTWNNAPASPVLNTITTVYGNLYLQKDMSVPVTVNFLKYNTGDPAVNRYMSFEGQKVNQLTIYGNDNFYLMPSNSGTPYDVEVGGIFNFDNNALTSNLYADGRKIKAGELWLGGNTITIDNALLSQTLLNILTKQTITAPNTSVYFQNYNGRYYSSGNANHFFGKTFKEGTGTGNIQYLNTDNFQVNGGDIRLFGNIKSKKVIINAASNITISDNTTKLTIVDSWLFSRTDCDLILNLTGQGGNNLILGNNINGNGFAELNRMNISGINASYIAPVAGAKPVNASNSIDNGNNSGINFLATTSKNFYWKGGYGNWNDLSHWSLDSSSTRTTANCGLPTINDNVFFDQYSGFSTTGITSIQMANDVSVNDITFSGLAPGSRSYFAGNNNYYKMNVNGNMVLHAGYYDAGYFSGFTFVNINKPTGTLKTVTPNGATTALNFSGDAQWKINRGSSQYDLSNNSIISQTDVSGNSLDISGTIMNLTNFNLNGSKLVMDNADLTVNNGFAINTKQPVVNTANSVIKLFRPTGGSDADIAFSNQNHYFEKIEYTNTTSNTDYIISFSFPGGVINNFIIRSAITSRIDKVNPSILLKTPMSVNNLTIEKNNSVALEGNLQVNQSLKILGDCLDRITLAGANAISRTLILPHYSTNPSNYVIDKVQLKSISSSGGQTYTATGSTDLGGNSGIIFQNAIPSTPRNLYWIGGQGLWRDPQHWSLTSGGSPVTGCDIPTAVDNVFFDQNSGFTSALNKIQIRGANLSKANNITFNNAPNQPVLDFTTDGGNPYYLSVYGNLTLQSDIKLIVPMSSFGLTRNIIMAQGAATGTIRYIDTKGTFIHLNVNAQDYFELKSPYQGDINFLNTAGFKTNSQPMTLVNFSWNQSINNNPVIDFGQSVITGTRTNSAGITNYYMPSLPFYNFYSPQLYISTGNNPLILNAAEVKADIGYFTTNTPAGFNFGDLTVWKDGIVNTGTRVWNFNKVAFLGSTTTNSVSTLSSSGKYKTLYFNPGSYQVDNHQTVTENLFMTGTPCNRISVLRSTTGQNTINLDPTATYTMFYASIRDLNFSRAVSAYGNSQDLGNTANLSIIPTNVQAAGFGGNKAICASEFPKTYNASTLYGTDPNATYTWTKVNNPNSGVISTGPLVTFTQPGNYRVNVTYSQDGCNITEDFSISSIALPADNTTSSAISAAKQVTGDIQIKFKGSLAQTYIFTYSINNGPDQTITSAPNGEAIILHSKGQTGTVVYRLKSIRFATGESCPVAINNKEIIVNINPDCPTPGTIMLMDNILRGCTSDMGARRLSEMNPVTLSNPPADAGVTRLVPGTGIIVKEGNDVFMIRNTNALPETLTLPGNKSHIQGAIIYHNDHFYEGVENGKWIRIDND